MLSLTPCAVVLVRPLCVAVSVHWVPGTVALPVLCHFDDGSLSSVDHCVQSTAVRRRHHLSGAQGRTGHHPLLCHFDDRGLPLHRGHPGVRLHGGRRRFPGAAEGVVARQTGRSAHSPGGDGDGGEAAFVLRDECRHSGVGLCV